MGHTQQERNRLTAVLNSLEILAEGSACEVESIPLAFIPSPTPEGDFCRDSVRTAYLLRILVCEFIKPNDENCCADAASTFLTDYAACPD